MKPLAGLLGLFVVILPLSAHGGQIPFHADAAQRASVEKPVGAPWNFDIAPSPNGTANYIFETVSSLLQQWPNTRYRNGEYSSS